MARVSSRSYSEGVTDPVCRVAPSPPKRFSPRRDTSCQISRARLTISSGTYAVVTSVSVIGLYFSYIIPVYLAWRRRGTPSEAPRGPWHLGRFGAAINVIAILWVLFITVILSIPDDMRAGKTMAGLTVLLGVWYLVSERRRFHGPAWAPKEKLA